MMEVELPGVGTVTVNKVVDCLGMVCPKPQLMAKKALKEMKSGEVVEILIDNPSSAEAVPGVIKKSGGILLGQIKEGKVFKLYAKKG
ncbi:MAG: sulfurtransferase TusA family protein [Candidatus Hydrothermarchaeota archaeon]|nr:MAG: sulfurtransferase TusA family protein [Candidatus Hydrothermarchaeota archaeon]